MPEEEINVCPQCGKNIQDKRGSLTQWVGLGDACKCDQKEVGNPVIARMQAKKLAKKCNRCRKPLRAKQSMTQWLIKTEICKCPAESDSLVSTDYTQLAMSKRNLNRIPREDENKSLVALLCIGVLLFALVCGYVILETLGVSDSLRLLQGRLKSNERKLTFGLEGEQLSVCNLPATKEEWNTEKFRSANQVLIKNSTISDDELERLSNNENLLRITLKNCDGFTAKGVTSFQKCPILNMLSFEDSKIDAAILKELGNVKVSRLDLSNTEIANADWSVLLNNKWLETLSVYGVPISQENKAVFKAQGFIINEHYFIRPKTSRFYRLRRQADCAFKQAEMMIDLVCSKQKLNLYYIVS